MFDSFLCWLRWMWRWLRACAQASCDKQFKWTVFQDSHALYTIMMITVITIVTIITILITITSKENDRCFVAWLYV